MVRSAWCSDRSRKAPPGFGGLATRGRVERREPLNRTVGSTRAGSTGSKTDRVTRERSEDRRRRPQLNPGGASLRDGSSKASDGPVACGHATERTRRRPDSAASRSEDALSGGSRSTEPWVRLERPARFRRPPWLPARGARIAAGDRSSIRAAPLGFTRPSTRSGQVSGHGGRAGMANFKLNRDAEAGWRSRPHPPGTGRPDRDWTKTSE
jgi:hypothetical protein